MVVGRKVMVTLRVRVPMVAITVTLYSAKGDEAENVRIRLELALLLGERKMLPGMRLTSGPSLMEGRTMAESHAPELIGDKGWNSVDRKDREEGNEGGGRAEVAWLEVDYNIAQGIPR